MLRGVKRFAWGYTAYKWATWLHHPYSIWIVQLIDWASTESLVLSDAYTHELSASLQPHKAQAGEVTYTRSHST